VLSSANDKKALRAHFQKVRRDTFSQEKCSRIAKRLLCLPEVQSADCVLLYASFGSEIPTDTIAGELLDAGKTVAYPRTGVGGIMTFHVITDLSQLILSPSGKFSIREPDETLPQPEVTGNTLCVLPGLAFTEAGGRLGYGGGFYDRFIADNPAMHLAALAFEAQITDNLPLLPHDIFTDTIITEERTVICNER
jgi:5-formyltetrahydrofolate cyclo-ligase